MIPNLPAGTRLARAAALRVQPQWALWPDSVAQNKRGAPRAPIPTGYGTLSFAPPRTAAAWQEEAKYS